jgi:hypothetical protein
MSISAIEITNPIRIAMLIAAFSVPLMLAACEEEGPAEKAGAAVDEAVQDTKRAVQDAAD